MECHGGVYTPTVTCIPAPECPPYPPPANGSVSPDGKTHAGDMVVVKCEKGLTLEPFGAGGAEAEAECVDGAYDHPVARCVPVKPSRRFSRSFYIYIYIYIKICMYLYIYIHTVSA